MGEVVLQGPMELLSPQRVVQLAILILGFSPHGFDSMQVLSLQLKGLTGPPKCNQKSLLVASEWPSPWI